MVVVYLGACLRGIKVTGGRALYVSIYTVLYGGVTMTGHLANLNSPLIEMSEASYIHHLYFCWFHLCGVLYGAFLYIFKSPLSVLLHICTTDFYTSVRIFVLASLHGTLHVLRLHIIFSCYLSCTTSVYMYHRDRHL
jgi:hypothetical protein